MIKIASLDDIKENNMIQVELDGDLYLLARNENKVFLTSDICTHEDAELSMGCLEGKKVKCPLHGSWFCLETGKALNEPAELPLQVFDVEIIDNDILRIRVLQTLDEPIITVDGEISLGAGDVLFLDQMTANYLVDSGVAEIASL